MWGMRLDTWRQIESWKSKRASPIIRLRSVSISSWKPVSDWVVCEKSAMGRVKSICSISSGLCTMMAFPSV